MKITTVSFGKKIPLIKGKILNIKTKEMEDATFFEYDCSTEDDLKEVKKLNGNWSFRNVIFIGMQNKHNKSNSDSFYGIENNQGDIICLCQTNTEGKTTYIKYLDRRKDKKYKYTGMMTIASLAYESLSSKIKNIIIRYPIDTALSFYTNKCGFKLNPDGTLTLNTHKMNELLVTVAEKTNFPLKNI